MGLIKSLKKLFKPDKIDQSRLAQDVLNYDLFDQNQKTILFVPGGLPVYDKDSGSNRLKEIILSAKKLNFNVILWAEEAYHDDKYVRFFAENDVVVYVESSKYKNKFEFLKSIPKVDFIWYYGPNTFKRYFEKLKKILKKSKVIYDMVDIHFIRIKRAMELEPNRISHKKRYKKYFKLETQTIKAVDFVIAISEIEKEIMSQYLDPKKLIAISNIHYPKVNQDTIPPFDDRKDIIFIGSVHTPNVDALYYLFQNIMPIVWNKIPDLQVKIIGNVNESIEDIQHENFKFLGFVENIDDLFLKSKLMVAPLRYGAGVKGKIGQAFEYYLPVVTSTIGAEGMFLENQKNALISDDEEQFANYIVELYQNKALWLTLSNNSEKSLFPFSKEKLEIILKDLIQ